MDMNRIRARIERMQSELLQLQSSDGAWRLCFDSGTMPDSYFIIILRMLGYGQGEALIRQIAQRILSRQLPNGAWKIYPDEEDGNLDATSEAYFALLYSGYLTKQDPRLQRAKQFILSKGGLSKIRSLLTQAILASAGQATWPKSMRIPLEVFFSEHGIGIDLYSLSGHARVHIVPIIMLANAQFTQPSASMPDLSDLFASSSKKFENDSPWIAALATLVGSLSLSELLPFESPTPQEKAVQFMFDRLEPDGTLLTYTTATMFMILALLMLGYSPSSPLIHRMVTGIRSVMCNNSHVQIASSEVWDTAMLVHALRKSGVNPTSTALENAGTYLRQRQQSQLGDWAIRNPGTPAGGWGFSNVNTLYPDVDDTTAALRAIQPYSSRTPELQADWQRGLNWVLTMRNDNGGWPAFEREGSRLPINFFAFDGAKDIAVDPSTVDLTSRTLQFLGQELGMNAGNSWIESTIRWVLSQQESNGSWYGRWGITYVHGTSAAIQGLTAVGIAEDHPAVKKGVDWLLEVQNEDGGWGESCISDKVRRYVPLNGSTPSQTAWALDGLTAALPKPTPALERGVEALLQSLDRHDWTYTYPTGGALPGSVYVHYASNNYIWPLLALSNIWLKYS
ncbi:prenyltransferase/squalene oxidase repeat-containing protein [Paenibacillus catalpae]|nr:prenyltransferase/squalene oxidase repeat-containing protein [Paenibacillus catalpae]